MRRLQADLSSEHHRGMRQGATTVQHIKQFCIHVARNQELQSPHHSSPPSSLITGTQLHSSCTTVFNLHATVHHTDCICDSSCSSSDQPLISWSGTWTLGGRSLTTLTHQPLVGRGGQKLYTLNTQTLKTSKYALTGCVSQPAIVWSAADGGWPSRILRHPTPRHQNPTIYAPKP